MARAAEAAWRVIDDPAAVAPSAQDHDEDEDVAEARVEFASEVTSQWADLAQELLSELEMTGAPPTVVRPQITEETPVTPDMPPLADELRAAADAMDVEAARLDTLDRDASAGPWVIGDHDDDTDAPIKVRAGRYTGRYLCASPDDGVRGGHDLRDADLIACRRNSISRDAAVLRATAELLRDTASNIDCAEADRSPDDTWEITDADAHGLAVARAFTKETA